MDLSNPGVLMSGLVISMVGMGIFIYGKKMENMRSLGMGLALMIFPYFVHSVLLMWAIAAACVGGLYFWSRTG